VLVTGDASFIGSRLVESLVTRGAAVTTADQLSGGRKDNLGGLLDAGKLASASPLVPLDRNLA
jgi:UDP-glucose 4-epimerase